MSDPEHLGATLGQLPTLPVFLKLRGRRVVLAGGGEPAVWKAEVLCAAGAAVEVFAEAPCERMVMLARQLGETLRIVHRGWRAADLPGAAIALGAIEGEDEAVAFRAAARAAGVPVNVVDKPSFCDFQFGTLVDRSPLVIAITTDGAAPVFGQAVRARIEALLPVGLRDWAEAAQSWRGAVQARGWGFRQRRRFWESFAERAMRLSHRPPTADDRDECFAEAELAASRTGMLTLVGCGSGRLDDVTFGVVRALQAAEVIIFDDDVPDDIINLGRREAVKQQSVGDLTFETVSRLVSGGAQVVWLGIGNAESCVRWRVRTERISTTLSVSTVACVSRCAYCEGSCHAIGSPLL